MSKPEPLTEGEQGQLLRRWVEAAERIAAALEHQVYGPMPEPDYGACPPLDEES